MNKFFIILSLFFISCSKIQTTSNDNRNDTTIIETNISDEIAIFQNEKKYFAIANQDTLDFFCTFYVINDNNISLRIQFLNNNTTLVIDSSAVRTDNVMRSFNKISYKEQMKLLNEILKKANNKFDLTDLHSIIWSQLIDNGDLAVEITNTYYEINGRKTLSNYKYIEQVIENSSLKRYLNNMLKPYSLSVKKINVENVYLISKKEFLKKEKIEYPTTEIPDKILNCSISILLSNIK
jgi:hypothetical protein